MNKCILSLLTATCVTVTGLQAEENVTAHQPSQQRYLGPAERAREKELRAQEEQEQQEEALYDTAAAYTGYNQYNTSHQGALHWPTDVTTMGEQVVLEDGSAWNVRSSDWTHTRNWLSTDQILVSQNGTFFSIYDYTLVNQSSGATVQANLARQPNPSTGYGRQITGFNDEVDYIYLDDGSVWSISYFDHSAMMSWCLNDTLIIGVNNGWDRYSRPNILINATMNQYIRAKCVQ